MKEEVSFFGITALDSDWTETHSSLLDIGHTKSSYWDIEAGRAKRSAGGAARNTADMRTIRNYDGWNFTDTSTWGIVENRSYPYLRHVNNAPFAFADTLVSTTKSFNLTELLANDYDIESLQNNLVLQVHKISNGSTDSVNTLSFPDSVESGYSVTIDYRIGELLPSGDTLWGNYATSLIFFEHMIQTKIKPIVTSFNYQLALVPGGIISNGYKGLLEVFNLQGARISSINVQRNGYYPLEGMHGVIILKSQKQSRIHILP